MWKNKEDQNLSHIGLRPCGGLNAVWELEGYTDPRQLKGIRTLSGPLSKGLPQTG